MELQEFEYTSDFHDDLKISSNKVKIYEIEEMFGLGFLWELEGSSESRVVYKIYNNFLRSFLAN